MTETDWMLAPAETWSERVLRLRVFINQQMAEVDKRHRVVSDDLRDNRSRQETTLVGQMKMLEGVLRGAANQIRAMGEVLLGEQSTRYRERVAGGDSAAARALAVQKQTEAWNARDLAMSAYWQAVIDTCDVVEGRKAVSEMGRRLTPKVKDGKGSETDG
jgi:hypothetical protein